MMEWRSRKKSKIQAMINMSTEFRKRSIGLRVEKQIKDQRDIESFRERGDKRDIENKTDTERRSDTESTKDIGITS